MFKSSTLINVSFLECYNVPSWTEFESLFNSDLDPKNYHWINTRRAIYTQYQNSKLFDNRTVCPTDSITNPDHEAKSDPQLELSGSRFLQSFIFHPKNEDRKKFDISQIGERQYALTGPLTAVKQLLPNLIPIQLFFIGAYTMRQAATGAVHDIGGMSWLRIGHWIDLEGLTSSL